MVFPTLPDAYLDFEIEVSFKPESNTGKYEIRAHDYFNSFPVYQF